MFGNRGLFWKAIAAAGVFAAACWYCHREALEINPGIRRARVRSPRFEGSTLWIPSARVESVEGDHFVIRASDLDVRVRGRIEGLRVGDTVAVTGAYRSNPPTLEMERGRRVRVPNWRRIVEVVSLLVLGAVLWLFFRRFRARRGAWEVRWPTS